MTRPATADLPKTPSARDILRRTDPMSAREHDAMDRRFQARQLVQSPQHALAELSNEEVVTTADPFEEAYDILSRGNRNWDWND